MKIIFGATGGIGYQLANQLAQCADAKLLIVGRDESKTMKLSEELNHPHAICDVGNPVEIVETIRKTQVEYGDIDGIANCVGSILLKPAHRTTFDEWFETIQTNLTSCFAITQAAATSMKNGGSIVFFSSAAARLGLVNHEAIAAAKAGVIGLVRSASATYAPRNIRFNAIAPGLVETPLTEKLRSSDGTRIASENMHPLRRFGDPKIVASLAAWLLDNNNDWITGQVFGADGGLAVAQPIQRMK